MHKKHLFAAYKKFLSLRDKLKQSCRLLQKIFKTANTAKLFMFGTYFNKITRKISRSLQSRVLYFGIKKQKQTIIFENRIFGS